MLPSLLALLALAPGQVDDRTITPFLDDRTVAVLRLDLGAIDLDVLAPRVAAALDIPAARLGEVKKRYAGLLAGLKKAGAGRVYAVFSLADDGAALVVVPLGKDADAKALA